MVVRSEIEKLLTYVGEKTEVTLDDAQASVGLRGETSFSAVCFAAAKGDVDTTMQKLAQALEEGFPPASMIRALQNHIKRLHKAKLFVERGMSAKEAMNNLHPKVFFREAPLFEAQLHRWSLKALENLLSMLLEAEKQSKTTHVPAETYCQQVFLTLARKASR